MPTVPHNAVNTSSGKKAAPIVLCMAGAPNMYNNYKYLKYFQISDVDALDCYVCTNQTGNVEKCLNTLRTCEPGEDVCGTEIRWGSLPYFSQGALKQYYVSKRCMTKQQCQAKQRGQKTLDDANSHLNRGLGDLINGS
uniref:Snake toxin/toxin-like domain-containing protein n=1 Tax=Glossina palpalis gambiensis TaxID=67801 RepID=A0A1B0B9Q4_9MUSC